MTVSFYLAAAVAIVSTILAITRPNAVHALLNFIVSLFATALMFFLLGAPFVAALEVIVYAGAIMVLFVFAVMVLNLGTEQILRERKLLTPGAWAAPALLSLLLAVELGWLLVSGAAEGGAGPARGALAGSAVEPKEVGLVLLGPYLLGVELASMLLLAGLVGAYHLGRREPDSREVAS